MKTQASHAHVKPTIQDALKVIEESSYRLTRPRETLLQAILKFDKPFSASMLEKKNAWQKRLRFGDDLSNARYFVDLGLIEKCDFSDDMVYYEVTLGHKGHHHHHIICTSCKKVEPLEFCIVDGQQQMLQKLGYSNLKHRLEFSGTCPTCS